MFIFLLLEFFFACVCRHCHGTSPSRSGKLLPW